MSLSDRLARIADQQRHAARSEEQHAARPAVPFDMEKFTAIFAEVLCGDAPEDEHARIEQEMIAAYRSIGRGP